MAAGGGANPKADDAFSKFMSEVECCVLPPQMQIHASI